jgi:ferric-dicitrate binding protein FerR (iron transport regulator)
MLLTDDYLPAEDLNMVLRWLVVDDERSEQKAGIFASRFAQLIKKGENHKDALRLWPQLAARLGIITKARVRRPLYRHAALRIAAVLLPAAALAFIFLYRNIVTTPTEPLVAQQTSTAPVEAQKVVVAPQSECTLPDNSTVKLSEGCKLRYPENFEKERYVELDGEARFNVSSTGDTFEVRTDDMKVSVLGTMFRVDTHACDVDLYHGSVDVEAAGASIIMTPGQHLHYNRATARMEVTIIPLAERIYDGMPGLAFENVRIAEVLRTMEQDYGVGFRIGNNTEFEAQEVWGDFTHFGSIEEVMSMLQRISGRFTYEITTDEVIIRGI